MTDNTSDYPAAIDPTPPELLDDHDYAPLDGFIWAKNAIIAVQTELGAEPASMTSVDGKPFGTLAGLLGVLFSLEVGTDSFSNSATEKRIDFNTVFDRPPVVLIQADVATTGYQAEIYAKQVDKEGFYVGWSEAATFPATVNVQWLAIVPPFNAEAT